MPNIKPLRDVDEHVVINLFAFSGALPVSKGTLVRIETGYDAGADPLSLAAGTVGQSYQNTVSTRWVVPHKVSTAGTGDRPIGMLLYDVRETDENGELLIFKPRKRWEMQTALSGEAVPILTKGLVLYTGVANNQSPTGGALAYIGAAGVLSTAGAGTSIVSVGRFLGPTDSNGWVLVKLELEAI